MRLRIGMITLIGVILSGCSSIDSLSDADLARDLQIGSSKAVEYGAKLAFDKYPDKAADIRKELMAASLIIKTNIVPSFMSPTNEVVAGAVKTSATMISSKLVNEQLKATIVAAVELLSGYVKLPDNPLMKVDQRTKLALIGLFTGIAEGIDLALLKPQ